MYKNKKILAVIPARLGSKRVPKKNIKILAGEPLIAYTIKSALKSKLLDRIIVSTNDKKIAEIAKKYGAEVPFLRPFSLAKDETQTLPAIQHAVSYLKKSEGYIMDIIVVIQPTSPLVIAQDIDDAIKKMINKNTNSCITVCEVSERPEWMYFVKNDKFKPLLKPVLNKKQQKQDLPKIYIANGAVYATKRDALMKDNKIVDKNNLTTLIMPRERSIDIDEPIDFKIAEALIKNN